jgi:hypothetical protein
MVSLASPPVKKQGSVLRAEDRAGDDEVMEKDVKHANLTAKKKIFPPSILLTQKYSFLSFITGRLRRSSSEALDTVGRLFACAHTAVL